MDWVLERSFKRGFQGASFGEEGFTDFDFADDTVIFAETMESLVDFFAALSEESEHFGLRINWMTTNI